MKQDPDNDPLSSLLAMLRARTVRNIRTAESTLLKSSKLGSPTATVVNETTINLMYQLLSRDPIDYVNIAERISDDSDVKILLDFILLLLRERHLSKTANTMDISLRAR
jgi:hypothetical protein